MHLKIAGKSPNNAFKLGLAKVVQRHVLFPNRSAYSFAGRKIKHFIMRGPRSFQFLEFDADNDANPGWVIGTGKRGQPNHEPIFEVVHSPGRVENDVLGVAFVDFRNYLADGQTLRPPHEAHFVDGHPNDIPVHRAGIDLVRRSLVKDHRKIFGPNLGNQRGDRTGPVDNMIYPVARFVVASSSFWHPIVIKGLHNLILGLGNSRFCAAARYFDSLC